MIITAGFVFVVLTVLVGIPAVLLLRSCSKWVRLEGLMENMGVKNEKK